MGWPDTGAPGGPARPGSGSSAPGAADPAEHDHTTTGQDSFIRQAELRRPTDNDRERPSPQGGTAAETPGRGRLHPPCRTSGARRCGAERGQPPQSLPVEGRLGRADPGRSSGTVIAAVRAISLALSARHRPSASTLPHVPTAPLQPISHTAPSAPRRPHSLRSPCAAQRKPGALLTRAGRTPRCWHPR